MKKVTMLFMAISVAIALQANNIQLANVGLSGQNTTGHFSLIGFDVAWENSWRVSNNENNYDAAWVFAKFRKKGTTSWLHATLNTTGHTAATGATITTPTDGKGVFIYRTADGLGNVSYIANKLRWNYGADGVLDSDSVEVNVYACEMVYVPQGAFYLGSNGTETGHFQRGDKDTAFQVAGESSISMGTGSAANLYFAAGGFAGSPSASLPAAFPKGFAAFYCMKYECSQQQYLDFLLNLDATRSANRTPASVFTGAYPTLTTATPERAMQTVSLQDLAAYLDWACLRPMTELEYEKACRGYNITASPNEFPWGNSSVTPTSGVVNAGMDNETVTAGNAVYNNALGRPARTGIFATNSSTRISSGGTYYGIMEMGGNVYEWTISTGNAAGRSFTGGHGDGNLDATGASDISQLQTNAAFGTRGGSWNDDVSYMRTSDRYYGNYGPSIAITNRTPGFGIRCVRTAP